MRNDFETVMKTSSLHFSFGEVFLRSAKSKQACIPLSLSENVLCWLKESLRQASKKELVHFFEREQTSPKVTEAKERAFRGGGKNPVHHARQLAERRNPLRSHRSAPLPCYGKRIFSVTPQVGEITTEYNPTFYSNVLPKYSFNAKELDEETGMYYYEARYYKPPVFTSRDPMFEKYFWMTPYAYCANNPVKYVDPSGKDGVIVIKGNQITISANVYLYGSGATKEVASQIQSDVNNKWGGNYSVSSANGNSFNVSVNINVALYGNKEKNNPFIIPESWNPLNRDNFIKIDENAKRSYVYGGDEGVWRGNGRNGKTLAEDDPAPHEVGHLLGLGDKYQDINGKSVMFKGWENNIMANGQKGIVEQRNINDILKDALKAYDEWIKNADNKGKEFRYEIN